MREMMIKPEITEMCRNEVMDFIIELVQRELRNIPEGTQSRRKELCEAILSVTVESGERAKLREDAGSLVKAWKAQEEQIDGLERLGFTVTKGKKHYKMRWRDSGTLKHCRHRHRIFGPVRTGLPRCLQNSFEAGKFNHESRTGQGRKTQA